MKIFLTISGILITAISHSICCIIPSITLLIGTTTSIVSFHFLEDYKWLFFAINISLLAYSFYTLYFKTRNATDCECDHAEEKKKFARKKLTLWFATAFSLFILILPFIQDEEDISTKTEMANDF